LLGLIKKENKINYGIEIKKYQGKNVKLVDVSSSNKYRPYLLDCSGEYSKGEEVVIENVEMNIVCLRKVIDGEFLEISCEEIQLAESK
jgi:hypothetical protein